MFQSHTVISETFCDELSQTKHKMSQGQSINASDKLSDEYSKLMFRFHYITGKLPDLKRTIDYNESDIIELVTNEPDLYTEEEMAQKREKLNELKQKYKYFEALLIVLKYESEEIWKKYQNSLTG